LVRPEVFHPFSALILNGSRALNASKDQASPYKHIGYDIAKSSAVTFRSILWREMFFGILAGQAKNHRNFNNLNDFHVSFSLGQAWDKGGTKRKNRAGGSSADPVRSALRGLTF